MEYRLKRNSKVFFNKIDSDIVIFDDESDSYYGMNPVASKIWELLDEPKTFTQIVSTLRANFNVSEADCIKDVNSFVQKMSDQKLIEVVAI